MKIIFDVGHPAHIHYFRNSASILERNNHSVLFTVRDKEITVYLINKYNIKHIVVGKNGNNYSQKIYYAFKTIKNLLNVCKFYRPDLIVSFYSPYASFVSKILKIPSIGFADSDEAKASIFMAKYFTDYSLTPDCFNGNLGKNHYRFKSYMELSYLHPDIFKPRDEVLKMLKVKENEKVTLIRLVAWNALHDKDKHGLSFDEIMEIIKLTSNYSKVFISSERELPKEFKSFQLKIPPEFFHDFLYYCNLYIGEGATTASECCMLGIPAIYINESNAGTLISQENYGLLLNFRKFSKDILRKAEIIISDSSYKIKILKKRNKILKEKINLSKFIVWLIENFPTSFKILKKNPDYQNKFL